MSKRALPSLLCAGLFLCAMLLSFPALAQGGWADLSAESSGEAALKPGESAAFRLTVQKSIAGEALLRVALSEGFLAEEESLAYRAAVSGAEPEIIWGNDGFVLLLPALAEGDELTFRAALSPDFAAAEALCTATLEGEEAVSLSLAVDGAPQLTTPPATPAPGNTPVPQTSAQGGWSRWALLFGAVGLLGLMCMALATVLKKRRAEEASAQKEEASAQNGEE